MFCYIAWVFTDFCSSLSIRQTWDVMMSLKARWVQCYKRSWICSGVLRGSLETRHRLSVCMLYSYTTGILKLYSGQWDPKAKLKLVNSEYVPLAVEQVYPTFQCQHLQSWGRHTWAFWAFGSHRDSGACGDLCGLCARQEIGKSYRAEERICTTVHNRKALFSLLCLQSRGLFKGLTCTSLSYILYKETLLWNSKPLCVSQHAHFQAKVRPTIPRLLGQDPFGEWWCYVMYFRQLALCISVFTSGGWMFELVVICI